MLSMRGRSRWSIISGLREAEGNMNLIADINSKGGVGKLTITCSIAVEAVIFDTS